MSLHGGVTTRSPRAGRDQGGFTIVEVLVAVTLLVTGMLGVAELGNVAFWSTSNTQARTGATNIARSTVEAARGSSPRNLVTASLLPTLRAAAPDLVDSDPLDPAWTVKYRGFTYTIRASVCTLDDPSDGIGAAGTHDASYCANPPATSPADPQPADAQQVTAVVAWSGQRPGSVKQVSAVPVGSNTALPSVTALQMTSPSACSTSCPALTGTSATASFSVAAANNPASLSWLVQGTVKGTCPPATSSCSGAGAAWNFNWGLGTPVRDANTGSPNIGKCIAGSYVYDGLYDVGARVQSANGLSGDPGSLSVALNRCGALAPPNFDATRRDRTTAVIDTEWDANPEGDIIGYRVYRGTSPTAGALLCPATSTAVIALDATRECTDPSPPAYSTSAYYYSVYGVDRDPTTGALREGALASVNVNTGNRAPSAPTALTAAASASGKTLTWKLPSATPFDADAGDNIDTFRVYRRAGTVITGPVVGDRHDREEITIVCPSVAAGATCTYIDTAGAGATYTYWVTAVDTHLRESTTIGPKTA